MEESRAKYGRNVLTPPKSSSAWRMYLEKFRDPMIVVLLVALILSFLVSAYESFTVAGSGVEPFFEPLGILFAVLLSTIVAFLFEQNAQNNGAHRSIAPLLVSCESK